MTRSRRHFLKTGTLVVLASAIPQTLEEIVAARPLGQTSKAYVQIPPEAQADPLYHYTRSSFSPYVNSIFEVRVGAMSVGVTLVEVGDAGVSKRVTKSKRGVSTDVVPENRFALLFRGQAESPLRQEVYDIRHAALGDFRLLLVPVLTPVREVPFYEAVINRTLQ